MARSPQCIINKEEGQAEWKIQTFSPTNVAGNWCHFRTVIFNKYIIHISIFGEIKDRKYCFFVRSKLLFKWNRVRDTTYLPEQRNRYNISTNMKNKKSWYTALQLLLIAAKLSGSRFLNKIKDTSCCSGIMDGRNGYEPSPQAFMPGLCRGAMQPERWRAETAVAAWRTLGSNMWQKYPKL